MRKRLKCVRILCGILLSILLLFSMEPMKAYATEDGGLVAGGTYSVTANMSSLTFSGASQATNGQDYSATISNNGGCQLPGAITVTVGGTTLAAGSSTYTYSVRSGVVTIKGEAITGNIVISATATAHQWSKEYVVSVGASCTQQGSQNVVCEVCGMTSGAKGITATGHKFVNYVSNGDATCSKDGTKTATCSNPGCTATSTITDTGSRLSHTSSGKRINEVTATCLTEGYTGDLICECGAIMKYGEVIPVSGHSEIVVGAKAASCNVDGYTGDTVCRYCDTVLAEGTVISAMEEHSYGEWNTVLEATTLKVGRRERVCSVCGMKESELIPASKWGSFILPLCIIVLILVGALGVGCGVVYAIKRINYIPNPLENRNGEAGDEAMSEDTGDIANDGNAVTNESKSEDTM